jgi:hypothetical protein
VEDLTGGHEWSMTASSPSAWLERLTWGPAVLLGTMFGATLLPVVLAPWCVRGRARIWWVASWVLGGLFWFGSSSLRAYEPLPLIDRMAMPVFVPVLVVAACAADAVIDRLGRARRWLVVAWLLAVIVPGAYAIQLRIRRERPEMAAYAVLRREAEDPARRLVVVTSDPRGVAVAWFYFGLAPPANVQLVYAPEFAAAPLPPHATVRALVSESRRKGVEKIDPRGDRVDAIEALHLPALMWHHNIRLYDAGDGTRLHAALQVR